MDLFLAPDIKRPDDVQTTPDFDSYIDKEVQEELTLYAGVKYRLDSVYMTAQNQIMKGSTFARGLSILVRVVRNRPVS